MRPKIFFLTVLCVHAIAIVGTGLIWLLYRHGLWMLHATGLSHECPREDLKASWLVLKIDSLFPERKPHA